MLILLISFLGIIFDLVPQGSAIQKVIILLLIVFPIFIKPRNIQFSKKDLIFLMPYMAYLVFALCSAFYISGSFAYASSATISMMLGALFFVYAVSTNISSISIDRVRILILAICFSQIFFSIIKFFIYGIDEKFMIGTMSNDAGQLGFLFPAISIPLVIYFLQFRNRFIMWVLVLLLMIFGIINEKRSTIYLLPLIIIFSMIANRNSIIDIISFRNIVNGISISLVIFISLFGARYIPSLNIDSQYGGDTNIWYVYNYAIDYLTMDYGDILQGSYENARNDENIQVGRLTLIKSIFVWIANSSLFTQTFGVGFGSATPSEWLGGRNDQLFEIIGTRGAISGAGLALVETGYFGIGILVYFFYKIHNAINLAIKKSNKFDAIRWYKTVNIIYCVFLYDFFFYSTTLLRTLPLPIIFFAVVATLSTKYIKKFNS